MKFQQFHNPIIHAYFPKYSLYSIFIPLLPDAFHFNFDSLFFIFLYFRQTQRLKLEERCCFVKNVLANRMIGGYMRPCWNSWPFFHCASLGTMSTTILSLPSSIDFFTWFVFWHLLKVLRPFTRFKVPLIYIWFSNDIPIRCVPRDLPRKLMASI